MRSSKLKMTTISKRTSRLRGLLRRKKKCNFEIILVNPTTSVFRNVACGTNVAHAQGLVNA